MVAEFVQSLGMIVAIGGMAAEVIGTAAGVCYPLRKRMPLNPLELVGLGVCCFICGLLIWAAAAFLA